MVILQEVKDKYLFGIVGILVLADIIFLIPPTVVSSARLRREEKEIEGDEVGIYQLWLYHFIYMCFMIGF